MTEHYERGHKEAAGHENPAAARRRGQRRGAGTDMPSGPLTERTTIPAKRDLERQQREGTSEPFATSNDDRQQREAE